MKNERLVRAITDIDDDLLMEAHEDMLKRKPKNFIKLFASVAACLAVMMFTVTVMWHRIAAVDISLLDNDLTDNGVVLLSNEDLGKLPRTLSAESRFKIPIDIDANGKYTVSVNGGCLVFETNENSEPSSVQHGEFSGEARVEWEVSLEDNTSDYEMTITKGSEIIKLVLNYNDEKCSWELTRSKQ